MLPPEEAIRRTIFMCTAVKAHLGKRTKGTITVRTSTQFFFLRSFSVWPIFYPYHRVLTGDELLPIAELTRTAAAHQAVSPVREALVNFFALLFKRYLISPQKEFKVR